MMSFDKKVSVVIPTYNGSRFIERAILSILAQTYSNFELIVVDDGSTDNTAQKINSINDERIKYIYKSNGGPASAYNTGFKTADSDFIFIMDHDDYSYPKRFQNQLEYMLSNKLDICGSFFEIIENKRGFTERKTLPVYAAEVRKELIYKPWTLFNPTLCIKRTVFTKHGYFNENLSAGYDYEFLLRVSDKTICGNVPEILYQWTLHRKSFGWKQKEKGNKQFQNISINKINSNEARIPPHEKYYYKGMVYYYSESYFRATLCFLKSLIFEKFNSKTLLYFSLSSIFFPAVSLLRRHQLFSHPLMVKLKRVVHAPN
jgi:glycosyltransferase involved in cell wall biosynthesis